MFTNLDQEEVEDVLKRVKNYSEFPFMKAAVLFIWASTYDDRTGITTLVDASEHTQEDLHTGEAFMFRLDQPVTVPRHWKKSIDEFVNNGKKIDKDVPDYVFKLVNFSYMGSTDYLVIYDNQLVLL